MNSSSDRPSITVEVQGRSIPVVGERNAFSAQELQKVIESVIFKNWVAKINKQTEYKANSVTVQSIDMFGPRIGFIKFVADVSNDKGIRPPGVVFMRGGAVAILLILTCDGEEYTILTCQPRVPIADFSFPEIPAGMIDGSGHFVGKAAQELKEETGIEITEDALVDMTSLAYGDKFDGVYPSPGGCDEFLRFFLFRKAVTKEFLKELEGKCTGLIEENESITLKVVPLRDAWRVAPDAKLLSSLCLYDRLKQENKLPPPSQL